LSARWPVFRKFLRLGIGKKAAQKRYELRPPLGRVCFFAKQRRAAAINRLNAVLVREA
jgi:hypothetical protein